MGEPGLGFVRRLLLAAGLIGATAMVVGATPSPSIPSTPAAACAAASLPNRCYLVGAGKIGSTASLGFSNLRLMAITGSTRRVLLSTGAKNPDVNLARGLIVFERYPGYSLWMLNLDGTNLHQLSPQSGGGWMEPRFTPDGLNVVAVHDVGGGATEIFLLNVATGVVTQVTKDPSNPFKWRPSLDSTSTKLIVTYGTSYSTAHIGVAPMAPLPIQSFTSLTPVSTTRPSYDGEFSADDRQIVFDAGGKIWIAAADGSGAHSVVPGRLGRWDRMASDQIIFTRDAPGTASDTHVQLWTARSDGGGAHVVADGNFAESFATIP
jgi:hypothetical protein